MASCLFSCFLLASIRIGSLCFGSFTIQARLDSKDVILGGSATFFCQFTGSPTPVVSYWSIGPTTPVPRAFRYSYNTLKTRFDILSVTIKDQGYYYCHATTHDGQKLNASAYLPVIDKFSIMAQSAVVVEGRQALLQCPVDKPQGVMVHWYFNGNPILPGNKNFSMEGAYQQVLRVPKATRALNGTYKCYAQNSRWHFEAFPTLTVEYAPFLISDVMETITLVNLTALPSCSFGGQPLPHISFLHDSTSVDTENDHFQVDNIVSQSGVRKSVLSIKQVRKKDNGFYSCFAMNKHGMITSAGARLIVKPYIRFPPYHEQIAIMPGTIATLSCIANATSVGSWEINGTAIDFSSNFKRLQKLSNGDLSIKSTQLSDFGKYECSAVINSNGIFGEIKKVVTVLVLDKPLLNQPKFSFKDSSCFVQLSWVASHRNGANDIREYWIKWQLISNEKKLSNWKNKTVNGHTHSLKISINISETTTLIRFKVEAVSDIGATESNMRVIPVNFQILEFFDSETNPTLKPKSYSSKKKKINIGIVCGSVVGAVVAIAFICIFASVKICNTPKKDVGIKKYQIIHAQKEVPKRDLRNPPQLP